jgi:hypothetical protein
MTKVFSFGKQLAIGQAGEARFYNHYIGLAQLDGKKGDFVNARGDVIEVKSDSYTTDKTANFFMEKVRNVATGKPGGPFQAKEHGAKYFVYSFASGECYWMDVNALVSHLEANPDGYETRRIENRGWAAEGYLVPRDSIQPLILKLDILPPLKK